MSQRHPLGIGSKFSVSADAVLSRRAFAPSERRQDLGLRTSSGVLIVAGGAGPRAGIQLQGKILKNTITDGSDQDHLDCLHISCGSRISDRTAFLQRGEGDNPGEQMGLLVSESCKLVDSSRLVVVGVPCVTFHAEPICSAFRSCLHGRENGDAQSPVSSRRPTWPLSVDPHRTWLLSADPHRPRLALPQSSSSASSTPFATGCARPLPGASRCSARTGLCKPVLWLRPSRQRG